MFQFNGLPIGKVPRILPIITMLGYSFATTYLFSRLFPMREKNPNYDPRYPYYGDEYFTSYNAGSWAVGGLIGIPIAGVINNLTWSGSSLSGSYSNFKYQLVTNNPNVDLFFYPKYEVYNKNIFDEKKFNLKYLWFQESVFKCRVKGATIINKK
jgi:hypothetical protein